jgi:adenosine 3'-phospho 5'-phosphosulfate transporter B3
MWLRQESRTVPLRTYSFLALTTVATMGFSNASLGYLNYPTQVLPQKYPNIGHAP